jgi:hypothetical protein
MARIEAERKAAENEAAKIARKHAKIQEEAARKAEDAEKVRWQICRPPQNALTSKVY